MRALECPCGHRLEADDDEGLFCARASTLTPSTRRCSAPAVRLCSRAAVLAHYLVERPLV